MSSLLLAIGIALGVLACANPQAAAAKDPMKCERDPGCARGRGSYADCTKQCSDDNECIKRCEQVQKQTDSLGH